MEVRDPCLREEVDLAEDSTSPANGAEGVGAKERVGFPLGVLLLPQCSSDGAQLAGVVESKGEVAGGRLEASLEEGASAVAALGSVHHGGKGGEVVGEP